MKARPSERKRRPRKSGAELRLRACGGTASAPAVRRLLYLVFALSGLTGLVYEATWTRYLQLFLGHAAYAQVLVLSLFMGGMAAGALLASRLSRTGDRAARRLCGHRSAAGRRGARVSSAVRRRDDDSPTNRCFPARRQSGTAQVLQWPLAAALILPQSILLGMTFPLMSASVLRLARSGAGACSRCSISATARARCRRAARRLLADRRLRSPGDDDGGGRGQSRRRRRRGAGSRGAARATRPPGASEPPASLGAMRCSPSRSSRAPRRSSTRSRGCACWRSSRARRRMRSRRCSPRSFWASRSGGLWIRGRIERYRVAASRRSRECRS